MREADAVMATLILGRLQALEANPDIGGTEAWTIKRTAEDIRQTIGSTLFLHVDELAPGLSPQKHMQMSLAEYRSLCARLLRRHNRMLGRNTVSFSAVTNTIQEPVIQLNDDLGEVEFDSEAVTAEIPVRTRNWREFWWDTQRAWKRWWQLRRKG